MRRSCWANASTASRAEPATGKTLLRGLESVDNRRMTRKLVGTDIYEELRARSLEIYSKAAAHAETRGVILADTKFEFGFAGHELILIDEVLTPDSSRYWPGDSWQPGGEIPSFDKQFVRDWLDSTGWDHTPPAPSLPAGVVQGTRDRYVEAFERVTGDSFDRYLDDLS